MNLGKIDYMWLAAAVVGFVVLAFQIYGLRKDIERVEAQRVTREVMSSWGDGDMETVVRTSKWTDETVTQWRLRHLEAVRQMRADEELGR